MLLDQNVRTLFETFFYLKFICLQFLSLYRNNFLGSFEERKSHAIVQKLQESIEQNENIKKISKAFNKLN